jgi:hypothetical protein
MSLSLGWAALSLMVAAGPADLKLNEDRLLLCQPQVTGVAQSVPAGALKTAAKAFGKVFIDYGAPCEQDEESMGAAKRAGVRFAIRTTAEGKVGVSRFVLRLNDAQTDKTVSSQNVDVPTGADAVEPLKAALAELSHSSPTRPPEAKGSGPWYVVAAGAAVMAVGVGFALAAGSAASDRDSSVKDTNYITSDANWRKYKTMSGVSLGIGGAAVAAGLAWRFAF